MILNLDSSFDTRELAIQIADQLTVIGKPLNLNVCVVIGGKDMVMQGKDLATKPHIVVATPGRYLRLTNDPTRTKWKVFMIFKTC
jgi:superfamily II DNA/RNA helicase